MSFSTRALMWSGTLLSIGSRTPSKSCWCRTGGHCPAGPADSVAASAAMIRHCVSTASIHPANSSCWRVNRFRFSHSSPAEGSGLFRSAWSAFASLAPWQPTGAFLLGPFFCGDMHTSTAGALWRGPCERKGLDEGCSAWNRVESFPGASTRLVGARDDDCA